MSFFACAVQLDCGRVPASFRTTIDASPLRVGASVEWREGHGFLGVVGLTGGLCPAIARLGRAVAIGVVRLDNRADVARLTRSGDAPLSDLDLAMRYALTYSGERSERLLGDFAFVVWDPTTRRLVAVRDTFGVRTLYHAELRHGTIAFSSEAELLASGDRFDVQYLTDRIAYCNPDPIRTVFEGVSAVPPATVLVLRHGVLAAQTYWSAREAQAIGRPDMSSGDACAAFRALFIDAVQLRVIEPSRTWSHLSGGLDSSSVVCVADQLARWGEVSGSLAGTVTYTDSLGTGADEKEYSDAIVAYCGLRNVLIAHRAGGTIDPAALPRLDQPNLPYSASLRDRATARVILDAGGHTALTGAGGDSLVMGTMLFFADWVAAGKVRGAVREMAHRAALGRVSFWDLAYQNVVLSLLPVVLRRLLMRGDHGSVPSWLASDVVRRFDLASRMPRHAAYDGRRGHKYMDAVANAIQTLPQTIPAGPLNDELDVRHPYLHRPLAELALQLTPDLCVRPHARKWVLREAMRGIVPEIVRTRVGKGTADGLNAWSLVHERRHLARLLEDPILAQLGCIEPAKLRTVLDDVGGAQAGLKAGYDRVSATLDVETWLQLRSGRWADAGSQASRIERHEVA